MSAQDVILAGEGSLFLLRQSGADDGGWRIVLSQFEPGLIAGVAIEYFAVFVDIDRHNHATFDDVGLERFELGGRQGWQELIFAGVFDLWLVH